LIGTKKDLEVETWKLVPDCLPHLSREMSQPHSQEQKLTNQYDEEHQELNII